MMITYPNAKINLGLNVVSKRPDGYHNLETVFYPIPLCDTLSLEALAPEQQNTTDYLFNIEGTPVDCAPEKNLVIKAFRLLQSEYPLAPVQIRMRKDIPFGAGLGGGSSYAAFMLKMLNDHFSLGLSVGKLEELAARLGADCAFFIQNRPTLAEGIGNIFTPISLSLKGYTLVLIKPEIHISTQEAYAKVHPHMPEHRVQDAICRPIEEWKDIIVNDFEESVFPNHPELNRIKQELYRQGAVYASMSGSGSSIYGIFPTEPKNMAELFQPHFYWQTKLEI